MLKTRLVRESDYSPTAGLLYMKKAKFLSYLAWKSKDTKPEQILTSTKGHSSVTN